LTFPAPIARARPAARVLYGVALSLSLAVWLLPLAAVMLTSLRSLPEVSRGDYWGWPEAWEFANYGRVLTGTPMLCYLANSLVVALPTVTGTILISAMAGTALALYRLRLGVPLFAMFIAGNLVPFQILMIPVRNLMVRLGVYDTYGSLILFHIAFQTGFCTLFMRTFIGRLPLELVEAARLAGAGELRIFWSIVLPLVRPAMAALAVLVFTFVWNDYFWALTLVQSDSVRPVTTGLTALRGQWVTSWQLVSAGSLVAALPPVVVFLLMQNHFISGLTAGARRR
jgi:multiple sugar transport system permease protein